MTRDDYEERRKHLDEGLRAGIELLQAAHAAKVRALDLVWMSSGDQAPADPHEVQEALSTTILGSGGMILSLGDPNSSLRGTVLSLRDPNRVLSHAIRGSRHSIRSLSVTIRGWSVSIRGWSVSIRGWSVAILGWSVSIRGWSVAILGWSVAIRGWSDAIHGWSDAIRGWSDSIRDSGVPIRGLSVAIHGWSVTIPGWSDSIRDSGVTILSCSAPSPGRARPLLSESVRVDASLVCGLSFENGATGPSPTILAQVPAGAGGHHAREP